MILPQEIIRKKRDGEKLSREETEHFSEWSTKWSISDGQIAALAMAIVINGMSKEETVNLTNAIVDTGMVIDWSTVGLNAPIIDGQTTGGVGDKTDILYAPIIAACGGHVPMISGHGLHHTGGTLDKMESIPNYDISPETSKFKDVVKNIGCKEVIALIKPQFEIGKEIKGFDGVVKNEKDRQRAIKKIEGFSKDLGFIIKGITESPITGPKGNKEYLMYASVK